VDGAVEKLESLHDDANEDCLESAGKVNMAFGSGSSAEKVGLTDIGREKFAAEGDLGTLCSKLLKLRVGSTLKAA